MYKSLTAPDLSELESEFELEMDDNLELEMDDEFAFEQYEAPDEGEFEDYEDAQDEFEANDWEAADYADRFYELAQRQYESESEIDQAVNEVLSQMEGEFFLGGLKKFKGLAGKLAQKGMAWAKKAGIPLPPLDALKTLIGPAGNFLKGNLLALAKPALTAALSAHPAGMAALPVLKALGFEAGQDDDANREAWNNYAGVAREAFETLAGTLHENVDNPLEASRLASQAFQTALRNVPRRGLASGALPRPRQRGQRHNPRVIKIGVRPGQRIILKIVGR